MRILKNKAFHKWSEENNLKDKVLIKAINEMENGLYEANLGGHVYKKRLPVEGRGKSGGVRVIIALKLKDKAFFVYGFAKNEKDNISITEKNALKALAKVYFSYSDSQINKAVKAGELFEVMYEKINT